MDTHTHTHTHTHTCEGAAMPDIYMRNYKRKHERERERGNAVATAFQKKNTEKNMRKCSGYDSDRQALLRR